MARRRPSGANSGVQGSPEESVEPVQVRPLPFAFEHGDLLSEGEDFESGIAPTANENSEG